MECYTLIAACRLAKVDCFTIPQVCPSLLIPWNKVQLAPHISDFYSCFAREKVGLVCTFTPVNSCQIATKDKEIIKS